MEDHNVLQKNKVSINVGMLLSTLLRRLLFHTCLECRGAVQPEAQNEESALKQQAERPSLPNLHAKQQHQYPDAAVDSGSGMCNRSIPCPSLRDSAPVTPR